MADEFGWLRVAAANPNRKYTMNDTSYSSNNGGRSFTAAPGEKGPMLGPVRWTRAGHLSGPVTAGDGRDTYYLQVESDPVWRVVKLG